MPDLRKGAQLAGRYTLEGPLGSGGEARTWLARDRITAAKVALKIVRGPRAAARLREEWQLGLRLLHAHIVRLFEFHEDGDLAFYSQQYVDGPDVSILAGQSPGQVLRPLGFVAEALAYAHGKDVVHRDVKASNVLLDRNGAPYLCDFGVAARAGSEPAGGSTIAASPQSLAGEAVSPADDIFALGGLIYELVAGRSPYSSGATAEDVRSQVPAPLRAATGEELPPAVITLVAAMLDKNPDRRPDAAGVVAALASAGFAPGTARMAAGRRPEALEERIETVRATAAGRGRDVAPAPAAAGSGVNARTVGIALGALVLILIGVVFVLPAAVRHQAESEPAAAPQDGVTTVRRIRESSGEDQAGEPRAARDFETDSRGLDGEAIEFNENEADYSGMSEDEKARARVEDILGELLSSFETLKARSVQRWAPVRFERAEALYAEGDDAYLRKNYGRAEKRYLEAVAELEPLFERVEPEFAKALSGAEAAFEAGDRAEALALYDLAVAITPNDARARAGYERARNLDTVLRLVEQGFEHEKALELDAAAASFRQAADLDPAWQPALDGIVRIERTRTQIEFETRMSEGFEALAVGDYLGARAAFRMAEKLMPESRAPADGLLQVDQGLRLQSIDTLQQEAAALEAAEDWSGAVATYEAILDVDANLEFAKSGLAQARRMVALHEQIEEYVREPDRLSVPSVLARATTLVVDITRMGDIGPQLAARRDELSRLLKRAATPVTVQLISDNMTSVSVYQVGQLGNFERTTLDLRPGTYVAVGVRPGFRDVRLEFRVAPEADMQPVVVRCEEPI